MRISDWSSDVCSSDLQRLKALPALSFSGRVALSGGSRGGGTGRIEWQQAGDRYRVTLSAPVSRQSWRLSGDDASATIEGIAGGPRSDTDRSEEHTSELQSLMRISYAVFCLNKKTYLRQVNGTHTYFTQCVW